MASPGTYGAPHPGGAIVDVTHKASVMEKMEMTAMGMHSRLTRTGCCCCIPLRLGGFILCVLAVIRGLGGLLEAHGSYYGWQDEEHFDFLGLNDKQNAFASVFWMVLVLISIGDVAAGLVGIYGLARLQTLEVLVFVAWSASCFLINVFMAAIIIGFDTAHLGWFLTSLICVIFMGFELYFLFIMVELVLLVCLQGSVAPSMTELLGRAQWRAVEYGHNHIEKVHLLAAVSVDRGTATKLLRDSGRLDMASFEKGLTSYLSGSLPSETLSEQHRGHAGDVALGHSAVEALFEAMRVMRRMGADRLMVEHFILAVCQDGQIVVNPRRAGPDWPVDAAAIEGEMRRAQEEARPVRGPPPPMVLGYLPVEETVAVIAAVEVTVCVLYLFGFLLYRIGIHEVQDYYRHHIFIVEVPIALAGAGFGVFCIHAIREMRKTHKEVREAVRLHVGLDAAQAKMAQAFDSVSDHPKSQVWLKAMHTAASHLGWYLVWTIARFFISIPVLGFDLVVGNVCGAYHYSLANVSVFNGMNLNPMHCTSWDFIVLLIVSLFFALGPADTFCSFVLWHEYSYGWTSTDTRALPYMDPTGALPQSAIRLVAGLPAQDNKALGFGAAPFAGK